MKVPWRKHKPHTGSVSVGQGGPVWPPVAPVIPCKASLFPRGQRGNTIPIPHLGQPQGAQPEAQGQTHFFLVCLCLGIFKSFALGRGISLVP